MPLLGPSLGNLKIVIDGNIGSGKTTQLNLLEKQGFRVKREPIEEWPLELYYSDPERWGFLFQMIILQSLKTVPGFVIYERSPLSSKEVFWKVMEKTQIEDQVYTRAYEKEAWYPDVYIYIDTMPQLCYEHLKHRTQEGDGAVEYSYLKTLDSKYKEMLNEITCDKYVINGNESIDEINKKINSIISKYVTKV
jgi:deoxyadenosine/deoxycytidine kinase